MKWRIEFNLDRPSWEDGWFGEKELIYKQIDEASKQELIEALTKIDPSPVDFFRADGDARICVVFEVDAENQFEAATRSTAISTQMRAKPFSRYRVRSGNPYRVRSGNPYCPPKNQTGQS